MSKKDYKKIAIELQKLSMRGIDISEILDIICPIFKADNDRFDAVKFREAVYE